MAGSFFFFFIKNALSPTKYVPVRKIIITRAYYVFLKHGAVVRPRSVCRAKNRLDTPTGFRHRPRAKSKKATFTRGPLKSVGRRWPNVGRPIEGFTANSNAAVKWKARASFEFSLPSRAKVSTTAPGHECCSYAAAGFVFQRQRVSAYPLRFAFVRRVVNVNVVFQKRYLQQYRRAIYFVLVDVPRTVGHRIARTFATTRLRPFPIWERTVPVAKQCTRRHDCVWVARRRNASTAAETETRLGSRTPIRQRSRRSTGKPAYIYGR